MILMGIITYVGGHDYVSWNPMNKFLADEKTERKTIVNYFPN